MVLPVARKSSSNDTQIRVPRTHGLPKQTCGSIEILVSNWFIGEWRPSPKYNSCPKAADGPLPPDSQPRNRQPRVIEIDRQKTPVLRETKRNGLQSIYSYSFFLSQLTIPAAVLLDQPSTGGNIRASSTSPLSPGYQTWERFQLTTDSLVTQVSWVGHYVDLVTAANNPVTPTADTWTITLADDGGNKPGAVTAQRTLAFSDVVRTKLGSGSIFGLPVDYYSFTATLQTALAVPGLKQVWLSVLSTNDTAQPAFGWYQGSGGDGVSMQYQLPNGQLVGQYGDRALKLEGSQVPEPGSMVLMSAGLLLVCKLSRLKRGRIPECTPSPS